MSTRTSSSRTTCLKKTTPNLFFDPIPQTVATNLPLKIRIFQQEPGGSTDANFAGQCSLATAQVLFSDNFENGSLEKWSIYSEKDA